MPLSSSHGSATAWEHSGQSRDVSSNFGHPSPPFTHLHCPRSPPAGASGWVVSNLASSSSASVVLLSVLLRNLKGGALAIFFLGIAWETFAFAPASSLIDTLRLSSSPCSPPRLLLRKGRSARKIFTPHLLIACCGSCKGWASSGVGGVAWSGHCVPGPFYISSGLRSKL